ncbi:MAG: hypothetical protein LKE30_07865 [Bacteroidales bacterium]|jgi:hypothetical protein|nr:hypothetical protein [Bacteroidales bacterium]
MEKYYYFYEQLKEWENDLDSEIREENNDSYPSDDVINALIEYSLQTEVHSKTLDENIKINLN